MITEEKKDKIKILDNSKIESANFNSNSNINLNSKSNSNSADSKELDELLANKEKYSESDMRKIEEDLKEKIRVFCSHKKETEN